MNLRQFLDKNNMSMYKFAKVTGITREYMALIVKGKKPGKLLAEHISRLTGGNVKSETLLMGYKTKPVVEQFDLPLGVP